MTDQVLFAQAAIIAFMGAALVGALLVARRGVVRGARTTGVAGGSLPPA